MTVTIKAEYLLDIGVGYIMAENGYRHTGSKLNDINFILHNDTAKAREQLRWDAKNEERLQEVLQEFAQITGIPFAAIYDAARIARRWHERTKWQYCIHRDTAERLLQHTIRQHADTQ